MYVVKKKATTVEDQQKSNKARGGSDVSVKKWVYTTYSWICAGKFWTSLQALEIERSRLEVFREKRSVTLQDLLRRNAAVD